MRVTVDITQEDLNEHWLNRHNPRLGPEAMALRRSTGLSRVGVGPFSAWVYLTDRSEPGEKPLWADLPKKAVAFTERIRVGDKPDPTSFDLSFS